MQVSAGSLEPSLDAGWGELSQCRWVQVMPPPSTHPSEATPGGKPAQHPNPPPPHSPYGETAQSSILTAATRSAIGISPPPTHARRCFSTSGGIYSCGKQAFLTTAKGSNRAPALTGKNNFHRTQNSSCTPELKTIQGGIFDPPKLSFRNNPSSFIKAVKRGMSYLEGLTLYV